MVAALSPLESTLTRDFRKHLISEDFNPRRIGTCVVLGRNSFEMCTYEKMPGVGTCCKRPKIRVGLSALRYL